MCVMLAKASRCACFDLETEQAVAEADAAMINGHTPADIWSMFEPAVAEADAAMI